MKNELIYNVEDKPKFGEMIVFAFQQVLAVLAATILVPCIIGLPVNIPSAILGAGLGTIVYLLFTKFKSPVVISSSFAFLSSLSAALAFGYMGIVLGSIFAGLVYVIIAVVVKAVGTNWVKKLLPPVIIGPVVAIIGLSLAGNAAGDIVTATGDSINGGYNLIGLLCGLITFFTVVICSVQTKSKTFNLIPFIAGIGAGYFAASIFSIIGYVAQVEYLQIIDWSPVVDNFKNISFNSFFSLPKLSLVEGIKELFTGMPAREVLESFVNSNAALDKDGLPNAFMTLQGTMGSLSHEALNSAVVATAQSFGIAAPTSLSWIGVAEVAIAFVPVAFVVFAEHIADHTNLGTIINKDLLNDEPGLERTLLGDGIGSIVGTCFGVCPNTTYGESVGCVAITKNASVRTIFTAAIMLVIISFLSPITAVLRTIPNCVMGGVCLTLYGFIAVSGLKMFKQVDLDKSKNLFTVSAILIAGIGGLSVQIPYALKENGAVSKTITITAIATALFLGVATYAIANLIERICDKKATTVENNEKAVSEENK